MMKQTLSLLLSALLLLGGFAFPAAADQTGSDLPVLTIPETETAALPAATAQPVVPEGYTPISTRAELAAIAENPSGSYALVADLNMDGEEWKPIAFSGKLEGNGCTLYNLRVRTPGDEVVVTYDGNRKEYDTVFAGLFSTLTDAEISNLRLVNADVHVVTDQNCFIAAIAGYAKNATLTGCTVQTRVRLELTGTNEGVGGLVGFSDESRFSACDVDCELTFLDTNPDVDCEEFMGGVFACGLGYLEQCNVKTRGFAEIYGYAHGGGLIGMVKKRRGSTFKARMVQCTSDTEISFFEVAPSKRCYCDPFVGEDNQGACYLSRNKKLNFVKNVSRKAMHIRPDLCEPETADGTPVVYDAAVTEPTCTAWGFTTFTCPTCGYTYTDNYTEPAHHYEATGGQEATCETEGSIVYTCVRCGDTYTEPVPKTDHVREWVVMEPAEPGKDGYEQEQCIVCGEAFGTRVLPALPVPETPTVESTVLETPEPEPDPITAIALQTSALTLTRNEHGFLIPTPVSANECIWTSDDPLIVTVDSQGGVTGIAPGTTTVHCSYGELEASAVVTVKLTAWQWIRQYILFGWLWDK